MFSSHRQLIRTPNHNQSRSTSNINDRQISKDLEFTPIGRPYSMGTTDNSSFPSLQASQATKATTTRGSPISRKVPVLHNHHAGSSFLFDDLGVRKNGNDSPLRSEFEGADILADISDDDDFFPNNHDTNTDNSNIKHTDFLDGSSNRMKEQLNELETLQKENLNLRIEVQALRKSMPVDKLKLMSENIDLARENQKLTNIIESQKENLLNVKNSTSNFISPIKYQNEMDSYRAKLENSDNVIADLKHDLQNLAEEKDELNDLVRSLEMDIRNAESKINDNRDEKDQKIEDLEIQLKQSENELAELNNQMNDLKLQNNDLRDQLDHSNGTADNKFNAVKNELENTKALLHQIEDERDQLTDQVDDFKIHINNLENQRDELSTQLDDLQTRMGDSQNVAEPLLYKIDRLKTTIKNLENELDQKDKTDISDHPTTSEANLQNQLNKTLNELNHYKSLLKSKDENVNTLQSILDSLKLRLRDRDSDFHGLNNELDDKESELERLSKKYNYLKQALENLQDLEKQKSKITSDKNGKLDSLKQGLLDTQRLNDSLYNDNKDLSSKNMKLNDEISMLKNYELSTDIENENRNLQNTISALHDQIHNLENALQVQDDSLFAKENELNKLKQVQSREKLDLQKELQDKEDQILALEQKLRKARNDTNVIHDESLEKELEEVYAKLSDEKRLREDQLTKQNTKNSNEIEKLYKEVSKLEERNRELVDEYETLTYHYKKLEEKYDEINESYDAKLNKLTNDYNAKVDEIATSYNETSSDQIDINEFTALANDLKKLTIAHKDSLADQSYQRQVNEKTIQRLNDQIVDKNRKIEQLESRFKLISETQTINDSENLKLQMIKDERDSLISEKSKLNRELNKVLFENDELSRKVDQLVKESKTASKLSENSDEFYHELQSKKLEMNELRFKLETVTNERDDLIKTIKHLENDVQKNVINQTKDANDSLKKLNRSVDSSVVELSSKLKSKELELVKLANDYNEMKNDLLQRIEKLRSEKLKLTRQLTDLNNSLEKSKSLYIGVQSQLKEQHETIQSQKTQLMEAQKHSSNEVVYPLSPKSPIAKSPTSINTLFYDNNTAENEAKLNLLKSQKELYRFKLQQYKNLSADLKYGNKYLSLQLGITERKLMANEDILNDTEDYQSFSRKKAKSRKGLRAAILCVMAVNRFKYRLGELNDRKDEENLLKNEIKKIRHQMNSC